MSDIRIVRYGMVFDSHRCVIFTEDVMTYICVIDDDDRIVMPADSIVKLGRVDEFQQALDTFVARVR